MKVQYSNFLRHWDSYIGESLNLYVGLPVLPKHHTESGHLTWLLQMYYDPIHLRIHVNTRYSQLYLLLIGMI